MDEKIRRIQKEVLGIFSKDSQGFALSGGTALELYYLQHRFSVDLDFFSPEFNLPAVEELILSFTKEGGFKIKLESEFTAGGRAKVRFYTVSVKGSRPLKIDFIEDVLFKNPKINIFNGVLVYDAGNIYMQKITAVTGTIWRKDDVGRQVVEGRREARDIFDIYMLSKKIKPLHIFLQNVPDYAQRGIVQWYRKFSRRDIKLALLDLDIYDKEFDSKEMIIHLESEIEKFIQGILR